MSAPISIDEYRRSKADLEPKQNLKLLTARQIIRRAGLWKKSSVPGREEVWSLTINSSIYGTAQKARETANEIVALLTPIAEFLGKSAPNFIEGRVSKTTKESGNLKLTYMEYFIKTHHAVLVQARKSLMPPSSASPAKPSTPRPPRRKPKRPEVLLLANMLEAYYAARFH